VSRERENRVSVSEICFLEATELARLMRTRELSAREVMEAQIGRVNKEVNTIVTFLPERAMERARAAEEALARGEEVGPLDGLPVAHKDLVPTKGVRTTFGSLVYKDFVPDHDALMLSASAGPDPRSPVALPEGSLGSAFSRALERDLDGVRIAWSRDLGGLPVDPRVTRVLDEQRGVFEALGCAVEDAEPELADADEIFKVWRA
jgi:Asp-tRNA(Asn)/Glu-tRNA(Gln) amidotransferase A subunit family amidase